MVVQLERALRYYPMRYSAAWVYGTHVRTTLFDGTQTHGYPPLTEEFMRSARDLGYGDDVYWHMMEHDLLHAYLAWKIDDAPSRSLLAQAHDQGVYLRPIPPAARAEEERLGAMQAALNGYDWGFSRLAEMIGRRRAIYLLLESEALLRPHGCKMTLAWSRDRSHRERATKSLTPDDALCR
jgi:hypothetical protein